MQNLSTLYKNRFLTSLACSLALVQPAFSQTQASTNIDEVERIIVTTDLSMRALSELPGSNIVLSETQIASQEARHLQDILAIAPNVNFTSGSSRGKFIQIRGIGERSQFAEPINPSIGLLIDDIDVSGLGSLATLFDLKQVEILSGPQSVAVGTNSLGGVIKLVSNPASTEESALLTTSLGQYGAFQLGGVYSNAITDSTSFRASIQNTKEDGFVENAFLDVDDTNNIDETSATLFFNTQMNKSLSLDTRFYFFDIDNGYDAFSLDNDNITQSDEPGFDKTQAYAASIKATQTFENAQAEITAFYLDGEFDYAYDEDWTYPAFHPFTYSSFDRYLRDVTRSGLDAKLNGKSDKNWVLGLSYRNTDEALLRQYTFNEGDFSSVYTPHSLAVFGQYGFTVSEDMAITVAARVEEFSADYSDSDAFAQKLSDTLVAASITLDYQLANALLFTSLSRGYKAGGFNLDERLSTDDRTFNPEYNWNIEAGVKGELESFDGRYQVTLFHMKRDDAQVNDFAVFENVLEDGSVVTSFADAIRNTDTGINQGVELTSQWQLSPSWQLIANLGYLDATFGDYERLDGSFVPKQDQAQAPEFTFYMASTMALFQHWTWFADLSAKDDYRFSDGHEERSPFTAIVNTNLTWEKNEYLVRLWIKNVFDRRVYTRGFGGFSNDPRDEYAFDEPYFQFGQERQVGVSFQYQF
uniref:TonB-dependent receptor n=1 Tax=Ningiella ruwaisensis TaxID=2364274 RepID=UPI0010A02112|nr:TonB-dependent receptor [Ningiella ruwaisensis]